MEERQPRKLAVILHADVVGSTTLVQKNESLAHARIQDAFRRFSSTIDAYNGVTHELRGDALVAEFARASDAVAAALAFQIENTESNARLEDDLQPQLRIGISLGEVVIADNTVTGAGVVLAQRVEQLAEPGGVCITGAIHEAAPQHLPLDYSDLGKREVKGFEEPVQVYSAGVKAGKQVPPPEPAVSVGAQSRKPKRLWTAGAIALLVLVVGGLAWWQPWVPREEPASIERMAFPLPDKPSIAVLPFTNMSAESEQEYFADGITDDLITDLSKLSGLFVIARNSTFVYKGKPVNVRQVAEELGVRYVLEGSVRRSDGEIRVNAQLIDALSGGHVWAERFDSSMNDVFDVQDEVTRNVVAALKVHLTDKEQEARAQQETDSPEAYDAFLRGRAHYDLYSKDDFAKAISYLDEAIQLDPHYARAHAVLAAVYWKVGDNEWAPTMGMSYDESLEKMEHHLKEALKNPTPLAHHIASRLLTSQGRSDEALAEAKRAVDLDPNDVNGYSALARIYIKTGRPAEALEALKKSQRLDPQGDVRGTFSYRLGESYFHLDRFEESVPEFEKYTRLLPGDEWGLLYLAAAYGHLGRKQEAQSALEKFTQARAKKARRPYTLAGMDSWAFPDETIRERYREGLRKAGMSSGSLRPPLAFRGVMKAPLEVKGAATIDATEAKALFDRGVPFVDVRSDLPWKRGHIPGAVHLHKDHDFTEAKLSTVVAKDEELVIYACGAGCGVTTRAVATAVSLGFTRVYFLRKGFRSWKAAGHPIEVPSE